jgi:hypothetical protein
MNSVLMLLNLALSVGRRELMSDEPEKIPSR